ncbi:MAG: AraC family transcriptional regulator [Bacilli bacterium]|nr:AraC family transcriptional regulator [Bacilli bacterium]
MNQEIEFVKYQKLKHIKFLVNQIDFKEGHIHNEIEVFLVLDGTGKTEIVNQTYNLQVGDIYFINSSDPHAYYRSADAVKETGQVCEGPLFLFAQISNHFLREYFPQIRTTLFKSGPLSEYLNEEELDDFRACLVNAAIDYFAEEDCYQLDVASKIASLLKVCYKKLPHKIISEEKKQNLKKKNQRLQRIVSYVDDNFDSQIRLEDIALQEGLSPTHFSHLFSSSFGITFQEYVNTKRMEQCIRLMQNQEKTLLEISYEGGFSDPKYMNRMFLKTFGCTPKEFRSRLTNVRRDYRVKEEQSENILADSDALQVMLKYKSNIVNNKS